MQTILLMQSYAKNKKEEQAFEEKQVIDGKKMLQSAREMIFCTLPADCEQKKLSKFLLAPAELESILANPDHLTARQIEKIEAGTHRPTVRNYQKLMQFYHRTGLEGQLLLETESLEVLRQRQEIVDFIIREDWERAWESFQSFKGKLNMEVSANQQEVLYLETDILGHRRENPRPFNDRDESALFTLVC